jgi:hypothetical protein
MRPELLGERIPVVGLHVAPCASIERLVGSDNRAGRLGDVLFRRESPDIGDLVCASAAQFLTPAAVVEEHDPATIVEDGFMSRRHRDATSVNTIINIGQGHEKNYAWHGIGRWTDGYSGLLLPIMLIAVFRLTSC